MLNRTGNRTCSIWEHIEQYSKRDLTYDSDSLNGLRATINSFTESAEEQVGSLWGILFSGTIAALDHDHPSGTAGMSSTMGMLSRARFASASAVFGYSLTWKFLPQEHQTLRRRAGFPTWSWTSCVGQVEYPRLPWLTPDQPVMPDPELDISVLGPDGCCIPMSEYVDGSLEPSRYLHVTAWSVRDALTFNLAKGEALLDLGDTDNDLKGFIQFDSIPTRDHKDMFDILSESQNSQKRWEALITYVAPGHDGVNVPFLLILAIAEDAQYPDKTVYERIGCIPRLHLVWKPKESRRAARTLGKKRQSPRPTMRWAAEIIEEQEKKRMKDEKWMKDTEEKMLQRREGQTETQPIADLTKGGTGEVDDSEEDAFVKSMLAELEECQQRTISAEAQRVNAMGQVHLGETDERPTASISADVGADNSTNDHDEASKVDSVAIETVDVQEKHLDETDDGDTSDSSSNDSYDTGDAFINSLIAEGREKACFPRIPMVRREFVIR